MGLRTRCSAWLGDTFVKVIFLKLKLLASMVAAYPGLVSCSILLCISTLLYGHWQPHKRWYLTVILALGITCLRNTRTRYIIIASFAAVSALFVLPTYPTHFWGVYKWMIPAPHLNRVPRFNRPFFIPGRTYPCYRGSTWLRSRSSIDAVIVSRSFK